MSSNQDPTIAFIGAGNMAAALIGGIKENGYQGTIIATDLDSGKLDQLANDFGISVTSDNDQAIAQADFVVLAVKPQVMKTVCEQLAPAVQKRKPVVVSIAAGLTADTLETWLGGDLAMVRCMPNTPALVQTGASGLFANDRVSAEQKALATRVFESVGIAVWVNTEAQLHAITAVSGSGPAYYFLFMEAMQKSAESLGLDPGTAAQLVAQTALGAARMVNETDDSPEQLRIKVSSPGGTTEQAIHSFEMDGLRNAVQQAMNACVRRSEEMAEELAQ